MGKLKPALFEISASVFPLTSVSVSVPVPVPSRVYRFLHEAALSLRNGAALPC